MAQTLFDKIWYAHAVVTREDGTALLWIDRHLVHDGGFHAFGTLRHAGCALRRPDLTFGVADRYAPSHVRTPPIADPKPVTAVVPHPASAPDAAQRAYIGLTAGRSGRPWAQPDR